MKLNLGCGQEKLDGYINIDSEPLVKPDLVFDFVAAPLPYEKESIDEVVMFHTIEHIRKASHPLILKRIHHVLKPEGRLTISYPEFAECARRWLDNYKGERKYWEATIFGRQLHPADTHLCAMDSNEFKMVLEENGFIAIAKFNEPMPNEFSSIITCRRSTVFLNYEELVLRSMDKMVIQQV
mgnify:CR=1 FL=1